MSMNSVKPPRKPSEFDPSFSNYEYQHRYQQINTAALA